MKERCDWIVTYDATKGDMAYALECKRCGMIQKVALPLVVSLFQSLPACVSVDNHDVAGVITQPPSLHTTRNSFSPRISWCWIVGFEPQNGQGLRGIIPLPHFPPMPRKRIDTNSLGGKHNGLHLLG